MNEARSERSLIVSISPQETRLLGSTLTVDVAPKTAPRPSRFFSSRVLCTCMALHALGLSGQHALADSLQLLGASVCDGE